MLIRGTKCEGELIGPKMQEMSWPEIGEVLKEPNIIILPAGSVEQHTLHLPVNVDSRIATYLAEQAARRVTNEYGIRVLVAPTVYYSETSTAHRDFRGTIGVSGDTLIAMIADIVRNLVRQGLYNILVLNGHRTNDSPIAVALQKANIDLPKARLYGVAWDALGFHVIPKIRKSKGGGHTGELETSIRLVIEPENLHLDKAVKGFVTRSLSPRYISRVFFAPVRGIQ